MKERYNCQYPFQICFFSKSTLYLCFLLVTLLSFLQVRHVWSGQWSNLNVLFSGRELYFYVGSNRSLYSSRCGSMSFVHCKS